MHRSVPWRAFRLDLAFLLTMICVCSCKSSSKPPATQPAIEVTVPATKPATTRPTWPAGKPASPAILPGAGLSQHDFFYAGEARTQDMYIVRQGQIVWTHHGAKTKGEISDATLLSNGNVLFAHQFGVSLIDAKQNVLWNYDAPAKSEIHTAQMIGQSHVLFIINGPEPRVMVVNIATNAVERQFPLPVKNLKGTHGQFRHARLTDAGTLLVAHMDLGKIVEYDENGKAIWEMSAPGCWSAERLKNGNTLITCNRRVFEINPAGQTVWEFTPEDIPDYKVLQFQIATRLPNGNTVVNNWLNQWNASTRPSTHPSTQLATQAATQATQPPMHLEVQAFEISPDKQLVWALRSWIPPFDLGPATVVQLLDIDSLAAEGVHFGSIH